MTTYRRKPIEVSAIVWTGENDAEVREFVGRWRIHFEWWDDVREMYLFAPHGGSGGLGEVGDAIVKDPDGGFSVVSAAVFSRDYEAIEEGL